MLPPCLRYKENMCEQLLFFSTAVCQLLIHLYLYAYKCAFTELLKDESSEFDIVGLTLPSLKSLLELPCHPQDPAAYEQLSHSLHGLLSTCLLNLEAMRYASLSLEEHW